MSDSSISSTSPWLVVPCSICVSIYQWLLWSGSWPAIQTWSRGCQALVRKKHWTHVSKETTSHGDVEDMESDMSQVTSWRRSGRVVTPLKRTSMLLKCVWLLLCVGRSIGVGRLLRVVIIHVLARVHNTLQRVSNANYHCTNTLGKVTWLAREIYYALWRRRAVRIHIVVTSDRSAVVFQQVARAMVKVQLLRTFVRTKYCRKSGHSFNRRTRIMLFCGGQ